LQQRSPLTFELSWNMVGGRRHTRGSSTLTAAREQAARGLPADNRAIARSAFAGLPTFTWRKVV